MLKTFRPSSDFLFKAQNTDNAYDGLYDYPGTLANDHDFMLYDMLGDERYEVEEVKEEDDNDT